MHLSSGGALTRLTTMNKVKSSRVGSTRLEESSSELSFISNARTKTLLFYGAASAGGRASAESRVAGSAPCVKEQKSSKVKVLEALHLLPGERGHRVTEFA